MSFSQIIFAGGNGSRMSKDGLKSFKLICGKPMIDIVREKFSSSEKKFIIGSEIIIEELRGNKKYQKDRIILQSVANGTGAAAELIVPLLDEMSDILLLSYADTPFIEEENIISAVELIKNNGADLVCFGFKASSYNQYGKFILSNNNKVEKVIEYVDFDGENYDDNFCNSGIFVIKKQTFSDLIGKLEINKNSKEKHLTEFFDLINQNGGISIMKEITEEEGIGVNTYSDILSANKMMQKKLKEDLMNQGVIFQAPETVFIQYDTKIGKGTIVGPFSVIEDVTIGENSIIGPYSIIKKSSIGSNVVIHGHNYIVDSHIGDGSLCRSFCDIEGLNTDREVKIGSFSRIRKGTEMASNSSIGSFTESKNTKLGNGSKVNHLSYVGDGVIGDNVNIGAGTVFCNYNGLDKQSVVIGDNVFIGSNTSLVAPVSLKDNAFIGAASLITKDVNENDLVAPKISNRVISGGNKRFMRLKKESKK